MSELSAERTGSSIIMVAGIGGAGGNAVNHMWNLGIRGVDFMVCNTDQQALDKSPVVTKVRLGAEGLGAGNDPENGRKAAVESLPEIRQRLEASGTRMIFITAGMGGGTGTGAAPVVARLAKEMGILTVGVVTKPFEFEAKRRMTNALGGIERIKEHVDTLVVIPNDKLLKIVDRHTSIPEAFRKADQVLQQAVQGITDLINQPALINLDFADVQTVMKDKGVAHLGIGEGTGDDKAMTAVKMAVESPLLETTLTGMTDVILNVSGNVSLQDVTEAAGYIKNLAGEDINLIFGANESSDSDSCTVTVIATGLESAQNESPLQTRFGAGAPFRPANPVMGLNIQQPTPSVQPQPDPIPVPNIQKPVSLRSTVPEKSLKIPDFLQRK